MSGWGCPHDVRGICQRVEGRPCDPGMRGCVLFGRFVFADEAKNRPEGPRERSGPKPKRDWMGKPPGAGDTDAGE